MPLLLDLPGLALVAGCLILGLGLAAGGPPWLRWGERAVIGIVLALVALTLLGYVLALAIGVTVGLVFLLALLGLVAGGLLLWRRLPQLPDKQAVTVKGGEVEEFPGFTVEPVRARHAILQEGTTDMY